MLDVESARVLARSGLLSPVRPDRLLGLGVAVARWGTTPAAGYAAAAARHPSRVALVDDDGPLTFSEVDRRTDRIAGELRRRGVAEGDPVGLLAHNGRGFALSAVALGKCGADLLYLGTSSAPGQLAEVLARERARTWVVDDAFADLLPGGHSVQELGELARSRGPGAPPRPRRTSRQVILTSGTTGTPRGAARHVAGVQDLVSALSRLPLRAGGTTLVAAPLFHAWGLGHLTLAMVLGSTVLLSARFDPHAVLAAVQEHRADALVLVPVLLDRLLAAGPERYDLSSLRVVASSGGPLPGDLATRAAAALGPVLHNLYGSTEVAYAAVATPADLARDPRCAGRPPHGVRLRVVDDAGRDVPPGTTGRVYVGSSLTFRGYTDGSDKHRLGDLVATGDRGVLDAEGRLTVLGRDDDMAVIGGENVFTGAVEDALLAHPAVRDAAVVAGPDPAYGCRLVAHVVAEPAVPAEQLRSWVRDRLGRPAVPREVVFTGELPRGATGKVQKRELRT